MKVILNYLPLTTIINYSQAWARLPLKSKLMGLDMTEWDGNLVLQGEIVLENLIQWPFMNVKWDWVISVIIGHEQYFSFILSFLGQFSVTSH